ncbi:MAG: hypothetical protein ISS47_09070 [Candidatus Omnitrophica bacterium]|nr:hypothetical protein [Candidatus Omnitrophota bacterium]
MRTKVILVLLTIISICFVPHFIWGQTVLNKGVVAEEERVVVPKKEFSVSEEKLGRSKLKKVWIKSQDRSNKLVPAWIDKKDNPNKLKKVLIETEDSKLKKVWLDKPEEEHKIKSIWIELPKQSNKLKRIWPHLPKKGGMQLKKEPVYINLPEGAEENIRIDLPQEQR